MSCRHYYIGIEQQSKSEVIRVQPGEEVKIKCNGKVCGGSLQGDVLEISMKKWPPAEGPMTVLATMKAHNLTVNSYHLHIADTVSKDMNITASGEEPATLQITTRNVQTDDAYICVVMYQYQLIASNVSCITRLLVTATPAAPVSTTDTTWGFTPQGHGGPPKRSPTDEQDTTGSMSVLMFGVGMMAIVILIIFVNLILGILK